MKDPKLFTAEFRIHPLEIIISHGAHQRVSAVNMNLFMVGACPVMGRLNGGDGDASPAIGTKVGNIPAQNFHETRPIDSSKTPFV
jgi:hypothetical protein